MIRIRIISKKDQGEGTKFFKAGQVIRHTEIEKDSDLSKITEYYDYEVVAEFVEIITN